MPTIDMRFSLQEALNTSLLRSLGAMLPYFKALDWSSIDDDQWHAICSKMVTWGNPCVKGNVLDERYQTFMTDTYGADFRKSGGRHKIPALKADDPAASALLKTCYHKKSFGRAKKITGMPGDIPFGVHVAAGKKTEKWLCWPVDANGKALSGEALKTYEEEVDHFKFLDCKADLERGFTSADGTLLKMKQCLPAAYWAYAKQEPFITKAQLKLYQQDDTPSKPAAPKKVVIVEPKPDAEAAADLLVQAAKRADDAEAEIMEMDAHASATTLQALARRFLARRNYVRANAFREDHLKKIMAATPQIFAQNSGKAKYQKNLDKAQKLVDKAFGSGHSMWFLYNVAAGSSKTLSRNINLDDAKGLRSYYKMTKHSIINTADSKPFIFTINTSLANTLRKFFDAAEASLQVAWDESKEDDDGNLSD